MSFALPARQVTFGRSTHVPQQQQQQYQQPQPQQQQQQTYAQPQQANNGLALPYSSNPYLPGSSNLALPGSAPTAANSSFPQPQTAVTSQSQSQSQSPTQTPPAQAAAGPSQAVASVAGPSTPPQTAVPSTPAPLTLEQQHITAVEGIVPTLQNIVATVNLDCRLDLKTIALHARNAEYNPKVCNPVFL